MKRYGAYIMAAGTSEAYLMVPWGFQFAREPWVLENGPFAKASTIMSPDGVRVEVVEPFQPRFITRPSALSQSLQR